MVAFFECLVLEESISKLVKNEIYKVLFRLVSEEMIKVEEGLEATSEEGSKALLEVGLEASAELNIEKPLENKTQTPEKGAAEQPHQDLDKTDQESAMSVIMSDRGSCMSVAERTVVSKMSEGVLEEEGSETGTEVRKQLLIPRNRLVCR